jgi:D-alanyl-D-alanine carboxypeptidase (penicillin-binding protein 5/6)
MGMLPLVRAPVVEQADLERLAVAAPVQVSPDAEIVLSRIQKRVTASGILILDIGSSQEVYARSADVTRPIASLTKMMTALIIVEQHSLDEWVRVPDDIKEIEGSNAGLPPGSEFTVGDLLSAILIHSANDAAETLARYHSGSVEAFVGEMNLRAKSLGLRNTRYANPVGFDDPYQHSTARDQAWLAMFVLRHPEIRERMATPTISIQSRDGQSTLSLTNTHQLLKPDTAIVAGKTGTTLGAGQCLLSVVGDGGREYVVVLLGSRARYVDMQVVLDVLADLLV